MNKNYTIQQKNCVIANGTAAGTQEFTVTLREDFDTCVGIALLENTDGGLTRSNIRIEKQDGSIKFFDSVNAKTLEVDTTVRPDDRKYSTFFAAKGTVLKIYIQTYAATTSEYNVDVLFHLSKDQ